MANVFLNSNANQPSFDNKWKFTIKHMLGLDLLVADEICDAIDQT